MELTTSTERNASPASSVLSHVPFGAIFLHEEIETPSSAISVRDRPGAWTPAQERPPLLA